MNAEITELLLSEAARINSPEFIAADPVQFPRRFLSSQPDAEIVSLLAAHIAWGNRKMICRDADRMLEMMDGQPHAFVMEGAYEAISDTTNIHRTFFGRTLPTVSFPHGILPRLSMTNWPGPTAGHPTAAACR